MSNGILHFEPHRSCNWCPVAGFIAERVKIEDCSSEWSHRTLVGNLVCDLLQQESLCETVDFSIWFGIGVKNLPGPSSWSSTRTAKSSGPWPCWRSDPCNCPSRTTSFCRTTSWWPTWGLMAASREDKASWRATSFAWETPVLGPMRQRIRVPMWAQDGTKTNVSITTISTHVVLVKSICQRQNTTCWGFQVTQAAPCPTYLPQAWVTVQKPQLIIS